MRERFLMTNLETLLPSENTVVEKLQIALKLVETLKQENQAYKDNFESVSASSNTAQRNSECSE